MAMSIRNDVSLVEKAINAVHQTTGIAAAGSTAKSEAVDGHLSITAEEERTYELCYEVKHNVDRRDQLVAFKARHNGAVLITRTLSKTMATYCRELGIQFIDQAGNCFLRQPGLFVFVSGLKDQAGDLPSVARGLTPAALRLVFAILTRPEILNSNVRNIAQIASISHGAAGIALGMLEGRGLITSSRTGQRQLAMPQRWLDVWTEGYLGRIRPKLEKLRMSAPISVATMLDMVSPQFREVVIGGKAAAIYLGGEAAAAASKLGLKPGTLTLYVNFRDPYVLRTLIQEFKLRSDPNGPIELVDMFWNTIELPGFPTVPNPLIYADLVGIGDERTMEVASILRKEICEYVESKV